MSDLERYIKKRKRRDREFAGGFEVGYSNFKADVLLKRAREKAGSLIKSTGQPKSRMAS